MNLVSVIIPNLHSPVIDQTLAALDAQDYSGAFEVIVVGQDQYGFVKAGGRVCPIFTEQPTPPAKARNIGIGAAQGDVLLFLDADCVPDRQWLSAHVAHYADPFVDVVGGGVAFSDENYWTLADNLGTFSEFLTSSPAGLRQQLPSLNLSVRSTVLKMIGLFDERYPFPAGEDADLTTRLRKNGFPLNFDPQASVLHMPMRSSPGSLVRHAYNFGRFSVKVDPRYMDYLGTPFTLRYWLLAVLFAPVMALSPILRLLRSQAGWRYLYTLPVIYVTKVIWCLGAADTLRRGGAVLERTADNPRGK